MGGYVCKIVFSSLFWVLFDFGFVCFLVGGGYVGYWVYVIVSPDESGGYLGFSTVTPPQRFLLDAIT